MRICYSGFNLYNQIKSSEELQIKDFTDFEYKPFDDVYFSHTYVVIKTLNDIEFHGTVNKTLSIKEKENIVKIACVDNIIFLLYKNGSIFKLDTATAEMKVIPNFANIENSNSIRDFIINIACGTAINVAVSKENKIFNIPNRLEYEGRKIKQIVTGHEHCLILDSNGDMYSFGCGIRGQLGHGTLENEEHPKIIEALAGVKIDKIAAGGWHSSAISATGDLYTWGWNSNGQLGLPDKQNVSVFATPQPVSFEDSDCNINDVACGSKHTIILIGTQLYGVGWNKYKQLGKAEDENVYEFKLLKDYGSENIILLKCGPWCSAVVIK